MRRNKKPVQLPVTVFDEVKFLIEQLQIMEHYQDQERIAQIAWKYGIEHYNHGISSWKAR